MGTILTLLLFLIVALMSLYLLILIGASWLLKPKEKNIKQVESKKITLSQKQIHVLVIIPAHNEEKNIAQTMYSLLSMDKRFKEDNSSYIMEIVVIADACTDKTVSIARNLGMNVVERIREMSGTMYQGAGKGQALDWFVRTYRHMLERNDFVVIIDADTIVEKNFMTCMLEFCNVNDVQVAQCFYNVLNAEKNWRNQLLSVALRALHHTRSKGRVMIGGSAGLKGNGMIFTSILLQKYGWPAYSIAEDTEFSALLAYDGIQVMYVQDTAVYGEMPSTVKNASEQRARWENGHWLMVKTWLPKFWKKCLSCPSLLAFDGIINCIIPPLSIFVALQCLTILLCYIFVPQFFILSLGFLVITNLYILSGLIQTRAKRDLYMALIFSPLYISWKLWIYIVKIGRNTDIWRPSNREKSE